MARSPQEELVLRASDLKNAAPEAWQQFLGAFSAVRDASLSNLTRATLDELPRMQGRAQIIDLLHSDFADCHVRAAKIREKK